MKRTTSFYLRSRNAVRFLMTAGLFIVFYLSSAAQGGVNFSGTWALNESKSDFGNSQFRMGATSIVITHDGNSIVDERTQPGFDGGEMKTTDNLTLDGKVCVNTGMMDAEKKSVVTWSDDKTSITIDNTIIFDMGGEMEMKSSETWKLAEGGKALVIESVFASPEGDMKSTLYYNKQ